MDYTDTLRRGSLIAYAAPDTGTLHKANYAAHYDQFAIRVVSGSEDDDADGLR